jgi:hypothetical protein
LENEVLLQSCPWCTWEYDFISIWAHLVALFLPILDLRIYRSIRVSNQHWSSTPSVIKECFVWLMVSSATVNNISVISWSSVLLVEEPEYPEKTTDLPQVTYKLYHIMLYASPWSRFELTTSVVIGYDCIGSYKSNYHTITGPQKSDQLMIYIYIQHWQVIVLECNICHFLITTVMHMETLNDILYTHNSIEWGVRAMHVSRNCQHDNNVSVI